ncbi:hypothetical protein [Anaerotruncus colihominis]|uniref:Uncharacterized protein n=1 Tax=Anaerotruncus colihominis DSM 17241 TaxID=445972 RepID=B0P675_9FIRM|nr:hypothetical protein ANACOL_00247 [Anaerotruncus colihominis DSM 17241]
MWYNIRKMIIIPYDARRLAAYAAIAHSLYLHLTQLAVRHCVLERAS